MTTMYVLTDSDNNPLGVFDSAEIPRKQIKSHFGEFGEVRFIDIRDSGLEWELLIETDVYKRHRLTMHYFTLNEI